MGYNKRKFIKTNDKKILHKVKKQWVVLSLSMLALLSGSAIAEHVTVHADPKGFNTQNDSSDAEATLKNRINANLTHAQTGPVSQNKSAQPQSQVIAKSVTNQANVLHNRIMANAVITSKPVVPQKRTVNHDESSSNVMNKQAQNDAEAIHQPKLTTTSDYDTLQYYQAGININEAGISGVSGGQEVGKGNLTVADDSAYSTVNSISIPGSSNQVTVKYSDELRNLKGSHNWTWQNEFVEPQCGGSVNTRGDIRSQIISKNNVPKGYYIDPNNNSYAVDNGMIKVNVLPDQVQVPVKYKDVSNNDQILRDRNNNEVATRVNFPTRKLDLSAADNNNSEQVNSQIFNDVLNNSGNFKGSQTYETYPPSQPSFAVYQNGNGTADDTKGYTLIPVAKQHVIAFGNWDVYDSSSAHFEVVSDGKSSNTSNGQFAPDDGSDTLIFTSSGPLNVNSWADAGYKNNDQINYAFSDDGNSSYPNALNRNSIKHIKFNPGVTVTLPIGNKNDKDLQTGPQHGAQSDVGLFQGMHNLSDITFSGNSSQLNASQAQNLSSMFENDDRIREIDLSAIQSPTKVTITSDMFAGDTQLSSLKLPNNGFGKLTNIAGMFASDVSLQSDGDLKNINNMDVSGVYDMASAFESDKDLTRLNLSNWNDSNLSDMDAAFANDTELRYLNIKGLSNPNMIIGGANSDFQNDFTVPAPNPQVSTSTYKIDLNKDMRLSSDSLLDGYWNATSDDYNSNPDRSKYPVDYTKDPNLFSPRQLDQMGANLGPNKTTTWVKIANDANHLHQQTERVDLYNQVGNYVGSRTIGVPSTNQERDAITVSDQLHGQSMPLGYRLPPIGGQLSDIVNGNLYKIISDRSSGSVNHTPVDYQSNGQPIKAYVLGDSDAQELPIDVEYDDQPGTQTKYVKVFGYYGDDNDTVPANSWQPGPGSNYKLDPYKSQHVENGLLYYNVMNGGQGYHLNRNAVWNITDNNNQNKYKPLLYYTETNNTALRLVYVNQEGQQVGYSDNISGAIGQQINVTDPNENGEAVPQGYTLLGGSSDVKSGTTSDGVYGNTQDTIYKFSDQPKTVFLKVAGDQNNNEKITVDRVIIGQNNKMTVEPETVSLQGYDGEEVELNPSDYNPDKNTYATDYSKDSVQFAKINENSVSPNKFTFYYGSKSTNGAPIAVRYIDNGHEVGSIQILNGNIGSDRTISNANAQQNLPKGYSLTSNYNKTLTLTFTDSPQVVSIPVQGIQYSYDNSNGKQFILTQNYENGNGRSAGSKKYYVNITGRVGDTIDITPYGFNKGGDIMHISSDQDMKSPSDKYSYPSSDHPTNSDTDLMVRINSDGSLSSSTASFNYQQNYQPISTSTIHVHYIALNSFTDSQSDHQHPQIDGTGTTYNEIDEESDTGTSQDTFNLKPYVDDIPETKDWYYALASGNSVVDGSNNLINSNNYQWKFGQGPADVYIKIDKNGDGKEPIIID